MKEYTKNGIQYTWDIVSSEGASFILFPEPHHTKEDIKRAKSELRNSRDVVSLFIASEENRDYLYKSDIFQVPEVRKLKWYQVEQDEKLLRRERIKGTTPEEFVKTFVLPFIAETEAKFKAERGDRIYKL